MLARITPGIIPPTIGTATLAEAADAADTADSVNYSNTISCTITSSTAAPAPSYGWRAYVSTGATAAADTTSASSFQDIANGVNNLTFTLSSRTKNHYYKVVVVYTDQFGNTLYEVVASASVQLTTLRWNRVRARGTGSFTFDTSRTKCDFIVVSSGGKSGTDDISHNGGGGFGVALKNITPLSGTFYYSLVTGSGSTAFIRRDSDVSTSNQILGVNGVDYDLGATVGSVSNVSGVFSSTTYSASGSGSNSGARQNSDLLTKPGGSLYWGDGGLSIGDVVSPPVDGNQGTYQILYYE